MTIVIDDDDDITRLIVGVVIKFNLIACQPIQSVTGKNIKYIIKTEEIIYTIQY